MARPESQRGSAATRLLVGVLVLALLAAVAYLGSEVNHRRYRLEVKDGLLQVERGRFLPVGFEPYQPESEALRPAYAPVQVPPGAGVDTTAVYGERSDLDGALYRLLSAWAESRLKGGDEQSVNAATGYLTRAELLPGLAEEQRATLHRLRGQLALREGGAHVSGASRELAAARAQLLAAERLGAVEGRTLEPWLADLDRLTAQCNDLAGRLQPGRLGSPPQQQGLPAATPTPAAPDAAHPADTPGGDAAATASPQPRDPGPPGQRHD
jgi:hypothetical protein